MRFFGRLACVVFVAFLSLSWFGGVHGQWPSDVNVGGHVGAPAVTPLDWSVYCAGKQADKHYTLTISSGQFNGFAHEMISVNGEFPGPLLLFEENDCATVTLVNQLNELDGSVYPYNTTVHFHGQHFHGSPWSDGVPGVTQCLLPNGMSMDYNFVATATGTSWYHGHYDGQYTSGLFGPYIVNPKNVSNYMKNVDAEWVAMLSDGYTNTYKTLINFVMSPQDFTGEEPLPNYFLLNGQQDQQLAFDATRGQVVLLRLINTAALSLYKFSIDGIVMEVVEIDGTAVEPYYVSEVTISVAQRISVRLDFSANDVTKYNAVWMRFDNSLMPTERLYAETTAAISFTGASTPKYFRGRAITQSDFPMNTPGSLPSMYKGSSIVSPASGDWNMIDARPVFPVAAPEPTLTLTLNLAFAFGGDGIFYSYWNGVTYNQLSHHMQYPSLYEMYDDVNAGTMELPMSFYNPALSGNTSQFGTSSFTYSIPHNAVVDVIINNTDSGSHPIHFHGYRSWLVDSSQNSNAAQKDTYILRDVVNVEANGWARFRFIANNPGSWILHCHIDWHFEEGLATILNVDPLSFLDHPMTPPLAHQQICNNWQQQEMDAFNAAVLANSYTPSTSSEVTAADAAVGTFIANFIICIESVFALAIYKAGIMYSILFDLVALNVGTLLGVCLIELDHEMWMKVSAGTLRYEIVSFVLLCGAMLPYIFEKFVKRGRVNKFAWLKHTQNDPAAPAKKEEPYSGNNAIPSPSVKSTTPDQRPAALTLTGSESDAKVAASRLSESGSEPAATKASATSTDANGHLKAPNGKGEHAKNYSQSISKAIVFHLAGNWEDENKKPDTLAAPGRHHHKRSSSQATLQDVQIEMNGMPTLNETDEPETPAKTSVQSPIDVPADLTLSAPQQSKTERTSIIADRGDGVVIDATQHGEYKVAQAVAQEMDVVLIIVMLAGDMLHNFVDGSIIASAFLTSNAIGLATSLGIFLEELPHLVGTFAVFVHAGAPIWKAVALSVTGAFPFMLGAALIIGVASDASVDRTQISYLLAFAVGSFLYITLADLVPVLTSQWNGGKRACIQTLCVLIGIGIQAAIAVYNHKKGEEAQSFAAPGGGTFDPT